jgi:hypothetical protein
MQILHGDGASYSSKAERFDGKVSVTITRVMALPMQAASMLWMGTKIHREGVGDRLPARCPTCRYFIVR